MSEDDTEQFAICVTCGEERPTDRFEVGDCTCLDCYAEGLSAVNYPEAEAADECATCGVRLGDHAIVRIDGEVCYICPGTERQNHEEQA